MSPADRETDFNLLDLVADSHGQGPPRALGRRLPALVAELLEAAGLSARHASATTSGESPSKRGWAIVTGPLDEGEAIELSRRMGPTRHLVFGQLGPPKKAGMTLKVRVLQKGDAAEVLKLERDFYEEELGPTAQIVAGALAGLLGQRELVDELDLTEVLGTGDAEALLLLEEGRDGLIAVEGGLEGADLAATLERLLGALGRDPSCRAARDHAISALALHAEEDLGLERALELTEQLQALVQGAPEVTLLLSRLHRRRLEPARAAEVLRDALSTPPRSPSLLTELAQVLGGDLGDLDQAAELCREALAEGAPELLGDELPLASLHEEYGLTLARLGDLDRALTQLERAVSLDPGHARAWANLGRCRHLMGDLEASSEAYERSLTEDPDAWEVTRNFAELLIERGDLPRAEQLLRAWASACPTDGTPRLALGELMLSQGSADEAKDHLEAAIDDCPEDPRLRSLLGGVLTQLGDEEAAEAAFRAALALAPDDPALLSNLAVVLSHRGQLPEAETIARRAVELDPTDPVSQKVLDHIRSKN